MNHSKKGYILDIFQIQRKKNIVLSPGFVCKEGLDGVRHLTLTPFGPDGQWSASIGCLTPQRSESRRRWKEAPNTKDMSSSMSLSAVSYKRGTTCKIQIGRWMHILKSPYNSYIKLPTFEPSQFLTKVIHESYFEPHYQYFHSFWELVFALSERLLLLLEKKETHYGTYFLC